MAVSVPRPPSMKPCTLLSVLGVPELSVKSLLHHFRTRYRSLLREEIAKTVESEANIDEEIRYLCATLSAEPH